MRTDDIMMSIMLKLLTKFVIKDHLMWMDERIGMNKQNHTVVQKIHFSFIPNIFESKPTIYSLLENE